MKLSRRALGANALALLASSAASAEEVASAGGGDDAALHIPAQIIPVPRSVSPEGQAFWEAAGRRVAAQRGGAGPSTADNAAAAAAYFRAISERFTGSMQAIALESGASLYRVTPRERQGRQAEVAYFDIHGGGFVAGGGEMCQALAKARADDYGVEVFAVDYRLLPAVQYPAPLDDCVAAYRFMLQYYSADKIVVAGSSAGGNLAAALLLRAKAENLPLPAGLILLTPATDMTRSGDSYVTNRYLDVIIGGGANNDQGPGYGSNADRAHPFVSPLFGDATGFPPSLLSTGTRDLLLSDTVRMHRALRRAGVAAELHVTEAGPHGGFQGRAPEDREVLAECKRFCFERWGVEA